MTQANAKPSGVPSIHDDSIPEAVRIPWRVAASVSWMGVKRRLARSLVTMAGVILAIAFLAYMLCSADIVRSLILNRDETIDQLLRERGVDPMSGGKMDQMMLLLLGLALLTCLVGIVNAMLMAVTERIKEIGTLKCVGAQDGFILQTYFLEASLQGIMGTGIGIVLGLLAAVVGMSVDYGGHVFSHFPLLAIVRSLLITGVAGFALSVLAAIAPAWFASRKQPVEALRVEE